MPSSSLLKELETAKAEAKMKFEKMDTNYLDQQAELPEDQEQAHTKAYEDAVKDYNKTIQTANATLDAQPSGSANVTVQAVRPPARIIEDLKPSEKLTSTMSLEAYRAWAEQYRNFMEQNTKAFEEQGLKTARAYLTKAIGSKLAMRLKTMRDDAGVLKVKDETTVDQVLKLLEGLYVEAKPLWVQRTNYFKEVQGQNESFDDFWSRKMVLKDSFWPWTSLK